MSLSYVAEMNQRVRAQAERDGWSPKAARAIVILASNPTEAIHARAEAIVKAERRGEESSISLDDPADPERGVDASNRRQDAYWRKVGGHPPAGIMEP